MLKEYMYNTWTVTVSVYIMCMQFKHTGFAFLFPLYPVSPYTLAPSKENPAINLSSVTYFCHMSTQ